jgi:hypothetical protein
MSYKNKFHGSWTLSLVAAALGTLYSSGAYAQDLDKAGRALDLIKSAANAICERPPIRGSSQTLQLDGSGKAELSRLLQKLVALNISGAVQYTDSKYEGLLQQDVAGAWNNSTTCREKVFDKLVDKLIVSP